MRRRRSPRARRTLFGTLVNVHTGIAPSFSRRRVALKTEVRDTDPLLFVGALHAFLFFWWEKWEPQIALR